MSNAMAIVFFLYVLIALQHSIQDHTDWNFTSKSVFYCGITVITECNYAEFYGGNIIYAILEIIAEVKTLKHFLMVFCVVMAWSVVCYKRLEIF